MNKRISFYSRPFPRVNSYYDMIDLAAEYGMESVEGYCQFELETPDVEAARELRAYGESKGVKFCCFSIFLNLVGDDASPLLDKFINMVAELL